MRHDWFCLAKSVIGCRSVPLLQIIDDLSLGEDRLIPIDKLCPETATLWSNLVQHVQSLDNGDNYIDAILPELLPFTIYIEKYVLFTSFTIFFCYQWV